MGRKWDKAIFDRYHVVASPSQMVDYLDCPRKWWFRRVCRLPVIEGQDKFVFGNILHAVIQRWLLADERGRDPNGNPVDIYPQGWEQDKDDDGKVLGSVNKREAQLIQMLVKNAVDSGLLRRTPGRKIEREFELEIVPGVGYIGALDVEEPEGLEDHKSTKDRKWISSEKDLANDPKMLSYAEIWRREHPEADVVKLRLNYMVKDPEDLFTKPVEVLVPAPDVEKFWNETIMPAAEGMLKLKFGKVPVTEWPTISGPQNPGVCKRYGGCTFAAICARMKTPTAYAEEINRANGKLPPIPETPSQPKTEKKPMGIFKKAGVKPAPAAPAAPVTSQTAVEETTEELAPEPTPAPAAKPAAPAPAPAVVTPWAIKGCLPCKGTGLMIAKGRACKACDSVQAQRGGPQSTGYDIQFNPDGSVSWSLKGSEDATPTPTPPPAPKAAPAPAQAAGKAQVTAPVTAAKPKTAPKVASPAPKAAPAPVVEEPAEPERVVVAGVDVTPVKLDVQVTGFRLFVNCIPMGGNYIDLAQILADEGAELADAKGAESFYALDSFKRRDMLAQCIASVAKEKLAGRDVVAIGGSQDLKAYAEALRPLATEVFIGVF